MVLYGPPCFCLVLYGLYGPIRPSMVQYDPVWAHMAPYDPIWPCMVTYCHKLSDYPAILHLTNIRLSKYLISQIIYQIIQTNETSFMWRGAILKPGPSITIHYHQNLHNIETPAATPGGDQLSVLHAVLQTLPGTTSHPAVPAESSLAPDTTARH